MKKISFLLSCSLMFFLFSCNSKKDDSNLSELTQRIQYEVNIKSPDLNFDWWVQNIEGANREGFVKGLLNAAYAGKIDVYNNYGDKLSIEQVKEIENSNDSVYIASQNPPYEDSLVITTNTLDINAITRISFLEEWKHDKDSYAIHKRVIGYAPLIEKYHDDGNFRGYKPLFWIYLDKSYPEQLIGSAAK